MLACRESSCHADDKLEAYPTSNAQGDSHEKDRPGRSATLVLIAGCVPSLNPIYTEETLVYDASLVGTWKSPKSTESWEFESVNNKRYCLTYTDRDGHTGRFTAHLADIDGTKFLDLFPEPAEDGAVGFYKFHLVPIHTVYMVKDTKHGMRLAAIDYSWLDTYLKNNPDSIKHATFEGRRMITASTKDVQAFVLKHKDRFTSEFDLERQEKGKSKR